MRAIKRSWILGALFAASLAFAHGEIPRDAPAERLIKNFEAKIKADPKDVKSYYRLGRVHLLSLERKGGEIPVWQGKGGEADETPAEGFWAKERSTSNKPKLSAPETELVKHLDEAVKNLNKAIELDSKEAKHYLTLACALEAGKSLRAKAATHPLMLATMDEKAAKVINVRKLVESMATDSQAKDKITAELAANAKQEGDPPSRRDVLVTVLVEKREDPKLKAAVDELLAKDWDTQTIEAFYKAMSLAEKSDKGRYKRRPLWGGLEDAVSYEAAKGLVRVSPSDTDASKKRVDEAKKLIAHFDGLPRPDAITPIVISMNSTASVGDLVLDHDAEPVRFNLDGLGGPQWWSWVKPETGILCWDPDRTGLITSGRQLFGSASWWVLFDTGYEALDALDDNRDGFLRGSELAGIAVWFDRNSNGVSDPGEVVPIESLGIAGLACVADGESHGCPMSSRGLELADGRVLPTYDWIAERRMPTEKPSWERPALAGVGLVPCVWPCVWAFRRKRRPAKNGSAAAAC